MSNAQQTIRQEIIDWHSSYQQANGLTPTQPITCDGIEFWCVGHNSTHIFFVGTRDNRRFCFDSRLEDVGWIGSEIKEIEAFDDGYFGHF